MKALIIVLGGLWLATATALGAGNGVEVYSAGNADLQVFVESIRGIVGPDDTVVPDPKQHRVVVITSPDKHQIISAMSNQLLRPAQNVRIDVAIGDAGTADRTEAGIRGRGRVVVRDGDVHSRVDLNPRLSSTRTRASSSTQQTLLVASGGEATLRVGESVPHIGWLETYGPRGVQVQPQVAWQEVGSFLAVQPTVLGDSGSIRVRITPVLTGNSGGRPHQVRFTELASEVTVQNGQTLDLGGLDTHQDFYSRFLVGTDQGRSTRKLSIQLTPTILGPGGEPSRP